MTETEPKPKQYTFEFPPEATPVLDNMAQEEGVSIGEVLRRALNFYEFKLDAKRRHKEIILEREGDVRERLIF